MTTNATKTTSATAAALATIMSEIRSTARAELAKPQAYAGATDHLQQKASDAFNKLEQLRSALTCLGVDARRIEGV
jgi:hypothetical protein